MLFSGTKITRNELPNGVGYLGTNFVGELPYADDVVLVCATPSAMRKLLSPCEVFAHPNMTFSVMHRSLKYCFAHLAGDIHSFIHSYSCETS